VILLLVAAVILPTVCLLWFMTQAVENAQLAVKTKLEDIYTRECESAAQNGLRADWVLLCTSLPGADGILVYDSAGVLTFPVPDNTIDSASDVFEAPFRFEYEHESYGQALQAYRQIAEHSTDNAIRIKADVSQARCLHKLDRTVEAIAKLNEVLARYGDSDIGVRIEKCRAHLLLLDLSIGGDAPGFEKVWFGAYDYAVRGATRDELAVVGRPDFVKIALPSALQAFALMRLLECSDKVAKSADAETKIKWAKRLVPVLELSLSVADQGLSPDAYDWKRFPQRLSTEEQLYGKYTQTGRHGYLLVFTREQMASMLVPYLDDLQKMPSLCRVYDEKGAYIAGADVPAGRKPFVVVPVECDWSYPQSGTIYRFNPGWSAHLYVDDMILDNVANRQAAVYLWSTILMVALLFVCSGAAASLVVRQQRMNRLKNDFVATVTHELKTPLASMRVLVDTLLEGRYEDRVQAVEYLQLISKENLRLTRLIDNFLTFSRMDRNRRSFEIVRTSAVEIVRAAVEALQMKLNGEGCRFSVSVEDGLPAVLADEDAMVMVLVNLLDNAYKYTREDKRIELKVFAAEHAVCFSVVDNGVGMTGRQMKRVFDRFYQADTSLSRRTEGAGLGLSIVKFICDAHHAKITVDSRPGEGSTFTVEFTVAD